MEKESLIKSLIKIALKVDPAHSATVAEDFQTLCHFLLTKPQESKPQELVIASPPQLTIHPVSTDIHPPLYSEVSSAASAASVESPRIYNPMSSYHYSMKSFRWSDGCDDDIDNMSNISNIDDIDNPVHVTVTKIGSTSEAISAATSTFVSAPTPTPTPAPASSASPPSEKEEEEEEEEEEEDVELEELEEDEEDNESIQIQEEREEVEDEDGTSYIELLLTNDTLCYRDIETHILYNDEFEEIGIYDPIIKRITLTK